MYVYVFNNNVRVDLLEEVRVKKSLYLYNKKMCVYEFACVHVFLSMLLAKQYASARAE